MTVGQARVPIALMVEILAAFAGAAVVVRIASNGRGPGPSLVAVAIVVVASFALARALDNVPERRARVIAVLASVVLLTLVAYTEYGLSHGVWNPSAAFQYPPHADRASVLAGLVALALVLLLGLARWSGHGETSDAMPVVAIGVAAVALAAIVDPPARGPHPFGIIAIVVFVLGWCLLALSRTADADEPLARFAARWSAGLGIVLGVAGAFTLAVAAFDPHTVGVLSPVFDVLARVLLLVLGLVLRPFVVALSFLFGLIPVHLPKQQHDVPPPPQPPMEQQHHHTAGWVQALGYAFAALAGLTIVLAFLTALWFAIRRRSRKPDTKERRTAVDAEGTYSKICAVSSTALAGGCAVPHRHPPSRSAACTRACWGALPPMAWPVRPPPRLRSSLRASMSATARPCLRTSRARSSRRATGSTNLSPAPFVA